MPVQKLIDHTSYDCFLNISIIWMMIIYCDVWRPKRSVWLSEQVLIFNLETELYWTCRFLWKIALTTVRKKVCKCSNYGQIRLIYFFANLCLCHLLAICQIGNPTAMQIDLFNFSGHICCCCGPKTELFRLIAENLSFVRFGAAKIHCPVVHFN